MGKWKTDLSCAGRVQDQTDGQLERPQEGSRRRYAACWSIPCYWQGGAQYRCRVAGPSAGALKELHVRETWRDARGRGGSMPRVSAAGCEYERTRREERASPGQGTARQESPEGAGHAQER
eukprot:1469593-Rhodomonas_salina.2